MFSLSLWDDALVEDGGARRGAGRRQGDARCRRRPRAARRGHRVDLLRDFEVAAGTRLRLRRGQQQHCRRRAVDSVDHSELVPVGGPGSSGCRSRRHTTQEVV